MGFALQDEGGGPHHISIRVRATASLSCVWPNEPIICQGSTKRPSSLAPSPSPQLPLLPTRCFCHFPPFFSRARLTICPLSPCSAHFLLPLSHTVLVSLPRDRGVTSSLLKTPASSSFEAARLMSNNSGLVLTASHLRTMSPLHHGRQWEMTGATEGGCLQENDEEDLQRPYKE